MGVSIVQSDADALWFKDPIQPFFVEQPFDFMCSQGALYPQSAWERWGFVLCTRFIMIRGTPASERLLREVCQRGMAIPGFDDQVVMNDLLGDMGTVCHTGGMAM
jgi:hypothetical protein